MDDHEGEKHLFRHRLYDLYHHCLYLDSLYHKTASRYGLWADIMSAFSIAVSCNNSRRYLQGFLYDDLDFYNSSLCYFVCKSYFGFER